MYKCWFVRYLVFLFDLTTFANILNASNTICFIDAKDHKSQQINPICKATFKVQIAATPNQIKRGLMDRHILDVKEGMIFVYPHPQKAYFWMKNTPLPLDIIFMDEDGKIVQIHEHATPYSWQIIKCSCLVKYVLEINAGVVQNWHLKKGDVLIFDPHL